MKLHHFSNLYGWAMSQKMPMKDFRWVDKEVVDRVKAEHIAKLNPEGNTGYIFEIDAEIPQEIHDRCVSICITYYFKSW